MKSLRMKTALLSVCFLFSAAVFAGPIYNYVGSWFVDQGPVWSERDAFGNYITPVFSGQEAAAFIYGGNAEDYVISTVSDQVNDINFKAWMDGWGDPTTYGWSGTPADHNLHIDIDGNGLYATVGGYKSAYSAYVRDHGLHLQNFAFKVTQEVPEPGIIGMLLFGLLGLGLARRKKS
jgi:hypothetical protein